MSDSASDEDDPNALHMSSFHVEGESLLPVWASQPPSRSRYRWIRSNLKAAARALIEWSKGPIKPQIQIIQPWFSGLQDMPQRMRQRFIPSQRYQVLALSTVMVLWVFGFVTLLGDAATNSEIEGQGKAKTLSCVQPAWSLDSCGLNGDNCRPFANASFAFKCPPECAIKQLWAPRFVGDQELVYQPFVIGGAMNNTSQPSYRGDSFICQAAVHAGIINDFKGGCGVLNLVGTHTGFPASYRHGIQSVGFDADFPKSFTFTSIDPSKCGMHDRRWSLLVFTAILTAIISVFVTSPAPFFATTFIMMFCQVGLVSDKPDMPTLSALISLLVERFLPAAFIAYPIYKFCVRPQLLRLTAHLEKTCLWLGGAWVGALNNYTFDLIPIQRLTPHDINAQNGAKLALSIIVVILLSITIGQVYYFRLECRLRRYLAFYMGMCIFLAICVAQPYLHLRLHHYVLALLLLPGTSIQTRPSLLYQGLLVGLFVNGVARWGLDSVLQTDDALRGGDGLYSSLLPNVTALVNNVASEIRFEWSLPPQPYNGLSVVVNDVERYRWYYGENPMNYTWRRGQNQQISFFRFAYMDGSDILDYTRARTWNMNGTWTPITR